MLFGAVISEPFEGRQQSTSIQVQDLWVCPEAPLPVSFTSTLSAMNLCSIRILCLFLASTISKNKTVGTGEIVQWEKCNHGDSSLIPRTHVWSFWWCTSINPALGRQKQIDPWGWLARQSNWMGKPWVPVRDAASKRPRQMVPKEQHPTKTYGFSTYMHPWAWVYPHTCGQAYTHKLKWHTPPAP